MISQTHMEKLTENHLCLTCKTIQSPIRHHNKIDHLRASVYCLRDLRLNCGLVLKLEDVRVLTEKCVYHIFSGYNQNMDSCYPTRNFGYVSGLSEVCLRYVLCGSSMF